VARVSRVWPGDGGRRGAAWSGACRVWPDRDRRNGVGAGRVASVTRRRGTRPGHAHPHRIARPKPCVKRIGGRENWGEAVARSAPEPANAGMSARARDLGCRHERGDGDGSDESSVGRGENRPTETVCEIGRGRAGVVSADTLAGVGQSVGVTPPGDTSEGVRTPPREPRVRVNFGPVRARGGQVPTNDGTPECPRVTGTQRGISTAKRGGKRPVPAVCRRRPWPRSMGRARTTDRVRGGMSRDRVKPGEARRDETHGTRTGRPPSRTATWPRVRVRHRHREEMAIRCVMTGMLPVDDLCVMADQRPLCRRDNRSPDYVGRNRV
jgi:hypothetical protein